MLRKTCFLLIVWVHFLGMPHNEVAGQGRGTFELDLVEDDTEAPLTCRVRILDDRGRPQRARGGMIHNGWNLVEGMLEFRSRPGAFTYQVFRGPQFSSASGGFTVNRNTTGYDIVRLPRHADLVEEGWLAGDLMTWMPSEFSLRWLPAEDLQMAVEVAREQRRPAPVSPTHAREDDRWVESLSYYDDRPGSGLIFHHWLPPARVPDDLPSSRLLVLSKQTPRTAPEQLPVHCEIQRLWARDVPIWLASNRVDSVQLLSDHLTIDGTSASRFEPVLDPDPGRFRGARGPGRMVENIYWQILEAGLRIPPTAGSGFGQTESPLGYNRVYAHASTSPAAWWEAVRAGRTFVTNGPLLRTQVNGQLPGHLFRASREKPLELEIAVQLTVSDPVEYLDVIFNGQRLYQARLDEYARQGGRIPRLKVEQSGWLVIRVITERAHTYRLATTAPYYVEIDDQPRISASAVRFFQRWLEIAADQLAASIQSDSATPYVEAAREYWRMRLAAATAP